MAYSNGSRDLRSFPSGSAVVLPNVRAALSARLADEERLDL
jgi:hypothetical protein